MGRHLHFIDGLLKRFQEEMSAFVALVQEVGDENVSRAASEFVKYLSLASKAITENEKEPAIVEWTKEGKALLDIGYNAVVDALPEADRGGEIQVALDRLWKAHEAVFDSIQVDLRGRHSKMKE